MSDKQLLTHSAMQTFKECRRKFYYQYELGLRRIDDARALRMGSAFHAGIEALSQKRPWVDDATDPQGAMAEVMDESTPISRACNAVRDAYARCPEQFDPYEWSMECETILRLVCAYDWRWSATPMEYVVTEGPFQIPLLNPATSAEAKHFDLAGKIDGIVRLEDGRLAVKETKTVSEDLSLNSDYWRRLRIDHQISGYIAAARKMGYPVDTVLYDVVRKPAIQPTPVPILDDDGLKIVLNATGQRVMNKDGKKPRQTASTEEGFVLQTRNMTAEEWGQKLTDDIYSRPEFYFARVEIPRLDQDVSEYQEEVWQIQTTIREAQRTGKWFRTVGRGCTFCPHFNHCSENQKIDPMHVPPGFQIVSNVHPELGDLTNDRAIRPAETTAPSPAIEIDTAEAF